MFRQEENTFNTFLKPHGLTHGVFWLVTPNVNIIFVNLQKNPQVSGQK